MGTSGALAAGENYTVVLLSLVASEQIKLRRIDGWLKIATVLAQHTAVLPGMKVGTGSLDRGPIAWAPTAGNGPPLSPGRTSPRRS